ncbi:cytochrome P450 [Cylindrobasidium torrendii FP15055 ss-10]|uniref:Cytochrome P450 n=1 Tax=Cylindrobasidium torrendii FP15055 ss-10 TaxID=1314674 RepID=A0A0D7B529_9AGAR|nr:cytochrome P450 [Cylindrobasidium torrendii FP15055 ss-10]
MFTSLYYIDWAVLAAALYFLVHMASKQTLSLPPGPKGYPIIGNLFDMPASKQWETFAKWGDRWGEVTSVTMFGKSYVILNSHRVAYALLDKRGTIYSDRPNLVMAGQLMGWNDISGLMSYGETLKNHRKMFHTLLGSRSTIRRFHPMEELEAAKFMLRLLETPEKRSAHIAQNVAALVLRITYGYEVKHEDDRMVRLVNDAMEELSVASTPGAFMVDLVPALQKVPEWFPGAEFKRTARKWKQDLHEMIDAPFDYVKKAISKGEAEESFVSGILRQIQDGEGFTERDLKWTAGAVFAAGGDTTVAALDAFFLLMMLNPDVQKKAQAEIDSVTRGERLPTFSDMEDLPYVHALTKELVRFHPVAPIGIPHQTSEDDIYEGHFIPKGSIIMANIWKMTHDPALYSNPEKFDPTRFMGPNPELDPREVSFGFGRRACPGRLLAQATLFIVCSMSLSLFDMRPIKGDSPKFIIEHGSVSHPYAYKCDIVPRGSRQRVAELLSHHIHSA